MTFRHIAVHASVLAEVGWGNATAFASAAQQGSPVSAMVVESYCGSFRSTYHPRAGRPAAWKLFALLADHGLHTLYCPELVVLQGVATFPFAHRQGAFPAHDIGLSVTISDHRVLKEILFQRPLALRAVIIACRVTSRGLATPRPQSFVAHIALAPRLAFVAHLARHIRAPDTARPGTMDQDLRQYLLGARHAKLVHGFLKVFPVR